MRVPGLCWLDGVRCSRDITAKYRALKRLAIQGHGHEREYLFFKGELRSRRTSADRWWYSRYWFGLAYDLFSDFGRSVLRPVLIWLLWAAAMAKLYSISAVPHIAASATIGSGPPGGATTKQFTPLGSGCAHPSLEGLYLAVRNGFPLSGARDQRVINGYACLYERALPSSGAATTPFPGVPLWIRLATRKLSTHWGVLS